MAEARQTQELIQRPPMVAAPVTLGFTDCFVLLLGFILMLISAAVPSRGGEIK